MKTEHCLYCDRTVPDEPLPAINDDAAWKRLAAWLDTRGHRKEGVYFKQVGSALAAVLICAGLAGCGSDPVYDLRLKDAEGELLPGVLIGQNTLYLESEGTTASYGCLNNADEGEEGTCGITIGNLYYSGADCSGDRSSTTAGVGTVFAAEGEAWVVSDQRPEQEPQSLASISSCNSSSSTSAPYFEVEPYDGEFPLYAPGPFEVVQVEREEEE